MPERGLQAPLSPHEEGTLRRVALGAGRSEGLPERDVARLRRLALVEDSDGVLRLTKLGRQRYGGLPGASPGVADDFVVGLEKNLRKALDKR